MSTNSKNLKWIQISSSKRAEWTEKRSKDCRDNFVNKRALEDSGDGPMAKYRQVLDEAVNLKSTNREFKTINHAVATYEQTKKGLSCFYPKLEVVCDGIHT